MNVLVFMDFSEMDEIILKQLVEIDANWNIGKICLTHYIELQELTDDFSSQFPELDKPLEEILEDELTEKAEIAGLDKDRVSIKIHNKGGKDELMAWVNNGKYHFCILGKKVIQPGSGVFASKVARFIDKSILFTTETSRPKFERILLTVDFSSYSKKAVKFINELIPHESAEFKLFHAFQVPSIYFPFVKKYSEKLVLEERKKAEKALDQFRHKYTRVSKENAQLQYVGEDSVDKIIYNYARTQHTELMVMGVKGKADEEDLLIGSVAEKLIQSDKQIPVLLVQ